MKFQTVYPEKERELIHAIETRAKPLLSRIDLKDLIDKIKDKKIVMLGEATHGTQEFYEWRRLISEWLIVKHGYNFIAVEGDWPPCWKLNDYIASRGGGSARQVLQNFNRWPTWMWANTEILRLAEWMKSHNEKVTEERKVGFYGLDVYSLFDSIDAVLVQLEKINPLLARRARIRFRCFDGFMRDEKAYAKSLLEFSEGCRKEVLENLSELLDLRIASAETHLDLKQNSRILVNAEKYYRTLIMSNNHSWNIRDQHMLETLDHLLSYYGQESKAIVWAHNTHIGDYRATDMKKSGLVNIGGLAREKWGEEQIALLGFGTDHGEVIASRAWDGPIQKMGIPPGVVGSYENSFHESAKKLNCKNYYVYLKSKGTGKGPLAQFRGHRAIGVVYQATQERFGNYVPTSLADRYDAFLFMDETTALQPLIQNYEVEEFPETWPSGL